MSKLKVLIVDDSARTISLIKESLSEDDEVEIVGQAENGVVAIEMIRETKPDVVFFITTAMPTSPVCIPRELPISGILI